MYVVCEDYCGFFMRNIFTAPSNLWYMNILLYCYFGKSQVCFLRKHRTALAKTQQKTSPNIRLGFCCVLPMLFPSAIAGGTCTCIGVSNKIVVVFDDIAKQLLVGHVHFFGHILNAI